MVDRVEQAGFHPADQVSFYSRQHLLILTTSSTVLDITVSPAVTVVSRLMELFGFSSSNEIVVEIDFIMHIRQTEVVRENDDSPVASSFASSYTELKSIRLGLLPSLRLGSTRFRVVSVRVNSSFLE